MPRNPIPDAPDAPPISDDGPSLAELAAADADRMEAERNAASALAVPIPTAAGVLAYDDVEIETVARAPKGRKPDASLDEFDTLVRTAPLDRVRKLRCEAGKARGVANRIGRAITRCKLSAVYMAGTAKEPDGTEYAYIRPKPATQTTTTEAKE